MIYISNYIYHSFKRHKYNVIMLKILKDYYYMNYMTHGKKSIKI